MIRAHASRHPRPARRPLPGWLAPPLLALLAFGTAVQPARPVGAAGGGAIPELHLRAGRPSDRDLLGARARLELPPAARARQQETPAHAELPAAPDTLRVIALRVEFVRENPDDPLTTGDGTFDLSPGDPTTLDPPPHDAAYFERQLLALRTYYASVSRERLQLATTLAPATGDAVFTLPHGMRYYNPDTTAAALDIRLAEFFRDAVEAGDADVDYPDFDAVMVFHAGVGQDLLFGDATPSDLPSAFISLRELREALAPDDPDYPGIAVEGGAHFVRDGFWLPETENQEGIEFSLHGVMVSLAGSQLGLPSLFNTSSGAPGIGRFGLMDQGAGNDAGRLPAAPCAWSRFFMGWETPLVVHPAGRRSVELRAALAAGDEPRLALVPIDSQEYFLVENRARDLDGNGTYTLIDSLGTVIGVEGGEYDGEIPGSGLLIWHIDEAVVRAGLDDNAVNADFTHRGVDLEEADGVEDIGLRPNGGFGLPEDAFFDPNATRFGPATLPPSSSNRHQDTHILLDGVSAADLLMRFEVAIDVAVPGWPDSARLAAAGASATAAELDGAGGEEAAWITADGQLLVRGAQGEVLAVALAGEARGMPLLAELEPALPGLEIVAPSAAGVAVLTAAGDTDPALDPWSSAVAPLAGADVVLLPIDPGGGDPQRVALAMAGEDGHLHIWGRDPLVGADLQLDGEARSNLAIGEVDGLPAVWVATARELVGVPAEAAGPPVPIGRVPLPASAGTGPAWLLVLSLPGGGSGFWLVERSGTVHLLDGDGNPLPGWPRRTGDTHAGPPALADLRGDGFPDLLLPGSGRLWALAHTGALLEGWPAALDTAAQDLPVTSGALVADLDGDGDLDAAVGSPAGGLAAFDRHGRPLAGWPLPAGPGTSGTPALADLDGDGDLEIVAAGDAGWLYAYDLAGGATADTAGAWRERGGHGRGYRLNDAPGGAAHGAGPLLEPDSIVLYPNPTRGPVAVRVALGGDETIQAVALELGVFDVTGRSIRELSIAATAGTLNEIRWDGRDGDGDPVPSGIYLLRITARGGGRTAQHFRNLAVTR